MAKWKVTDEQANDVLERLGEFAESYSIEFFEKYRERLTGLPIDNPQKMQDMRVIVRGWLAEL